MAGRGKVYWRRRNKKPGHSEKVPYTDIEPIKRKLGKGGRAVLRRMMRKVIDIRPDQTPEDLGVDGFDMTKS